MRNVGRNQPEAIRAKLREFDLGRIADRLLAMARPAVRVETFGAGTVPPGESKVGGLPAAPPNVTWPGRMSLLAQFDLAAVRATGFACPLAGEGLLTFFYDRVRSGGPGNREPGQVFLWPKRDLRLLEPPDHDIEVFHPAQVALSCQLTLPDAHMDNPWLPELELTRDELDRLSEFAGCADETLGLVGSHQLFGWPRSCRAELHWGATRTPLPLGWLPAWRAGDSQTLRRLGEAARGFRCLAQFDEDRYADLRWVDAGTCTFLIALDGTELAPLCAARTVLDCC